jgi:hypothetical protein
VLVVVCGWRRTYIGVVLEEEDMLVAVSSYEVVLVVDLGHCIAVQCILDPVQLDAQYSCTAHLSAEILNSPHLTGVAVYFIVQSKASHRIDCERIGGRVRRTTQGVRGTGHCLQRTPADTVCQLEGVSHL